MATWTWRTPVTNRTSGADRMRYTDMIRITENINYIREAAMNKGFTINSPKISTTTWTRENIITVEEWAEILRTLLAVADGIFYEYYVDPTNEMTWRNINNVEELTLRLYVMIEESADMGRLRHWVGDDFHSRYTEELNAGGY